MRVLIAPAPNAVLSEVLCACRRHQRCQLKKARASVGPRFMDSSRTSRCLPAIALWACSRENTRNY